MATEITLEKLNLGVVSLTGPTDTIVVEVAQTVGVSTVGATVFTQLFDTPNSYVGEAGKYPIVNVGATGLEFKSLSQDPAFAAHNARIVSLEAEVTDHETRITDNTTNIATNTANIASNDTELADHETRITANTANITSNDAELTDHETRITANTTNISSNDVELADHETRISDNTTNVATNTANIATNTANIATNTANIATNTANIATNTANIATNTANIAANTTSITSNDTELADHETRIAANTTSITSNDTELADHETRIAANTADISSNTANIATNTANITTNTANIASNDTELAAHETRITANTTNVTSLTNRVTQNEADIALRALDTAVVHKTGDETISDKKSFQKVAVSDEFVVPNEEASLGAKGQIRYSDTNGFQGHDGSKWGGFGGGGTGGGKTTLFEVATTNSIGLIPLSDNISTYDMLHITCYYANTSANPDDFYTESYMIEPEAILNPVFANTTDIKLVHAESTSSEFMRISIDPTQSTTSSIFVTRSSSGWTLGGVNRVVGIKYGS